MKSLRSKSLPLAVAMSAMSFPATRPLAAQTEPQAEWTIMVFMNGDNNLEEDAIRDFREIAKVDTGDKVNVVVQMDRSESYASSYGDWEGTMRFIMKKDMVPTVQHAAPNGGYGTFVNDGRSELNMGDPAVLRAFVDWAKVAAPAKRNMLIIWNHGQGFRLMLHNVLLANALAEETLVAGLSPQGASLSELRRASAAVPVRPVPPSKSVSNDDTDGDVLYNREIQDGLSGVSLDVIGFDACLMGMVETAYALREVGAVMIGSEDLEPGSGWQYDDWLKAIKSNPTIAPADLAKEVVASYSRTYGAGGEMDDSTTTLSAVDLRKIEPLAGKISELSAGLMDRLGSESAFVRKARLNCKVYAPKPFPPDPRDYFQHVDLGQFCDEIVKQPELSEVHGLAGAVKTSLGEAVLASYAGAKRQTGFGSNGLAIYFPANKGLYDTDPYEEDGYKKNNVKYPIEFVQKHQWCEFLHGYFSHVP